MKIIKLDIINFRGLGRVHLETNKDINVIAGPNAAGKSTILEAIRLIKTVLSPRYYGEAQAPLIQLGYIHPHVQAIGSLSNDFGAISSEPGKPVVLSYTLEFSHAELQSVRSAHDQIALYQIQNELSSPVDQLGLSQYLSSEVGKKRYEQVRKETEERLKSLSETRQFDSKLTFDPSRQQILGQDGFKQSLVGILDRSLSPDKTIFSLFPADRAFPQGEQPLQVGSADAQAQIQSHMASPASKYARLKQSIIQSIMLNPQGRELLEQEFNLIFDYLLPGKKLAGVQFNALGLLKVLVREQKTGRIFDIDQMSSGEKGLVLTFISMRLSIAQGGIALLDEPELHLNSAVQERIVPFIKDHCVKANDLQFFVCTHSPEMIRDAFQDDNCNLFHLRSSTDLTPILRQDLGPLSEIFERLGNSTTDLLSTKGNIYVEGEHDAAVLLAGFAHLLTGFQLRDLGGRAAIEREVPNLKAEEKVGRLNKIQLFILDNDRKPTNLQSTPMVRVRQLEKYCIENYLLNENILFDLVTQHAQKKVESRGAFPGRLEQIAMEQVSELALKEAYEPLSPENPGLRTKEVRGQTPEEAIRILADRIHKISQQVALFKHDDFVGTLHNNYVEKAKQIKEDWQFSWKDKCNGKRVIDGLYEAYEIKMSKAEFKKEVIRQMAASKTSEWTVLKDLLASLLI